MDITNAQRAEVLIRALPYIQKYYNKVVVVKYGGNAMINEELKQAVMGDIVLLSLIGVKVVLVHGGGPEISEMLNIRQCFYRILLFSQYIYAKWFAIFVNETRIYNIPYCFTFGNFENFMFVYKLFKQV